jgi:hypothetical protein
LTLQKFAKGSPQFNYNVHFSWLHQVLTLISPCCCNLSSLIIVGAVSFAYGVVLCTLTGFYETRIAYYSWRGYKGYSYSRIPAYWLFAKESLKIFPAVHRQPASHSVELTDGHLLPWDKRLGLGGCLDDKIHYVVWASQAIAPRPGRLGMQNISVYSLCSQENIFDCYLVWNTQEPFFLVGPGCRTRVGMLWTVKAVIAIRLSMLEQLKLYLVMVFKMRTKFWLKLTREYGFYCRCWFHFQLLDCLGSFNLVPQMLNWEILLLLQLFCQWSSCAKNLVDMVCILFSP